MQSETLHEFLRSSAGRGFIIFASVCAVVSAVVGYVFYYSNLRWYEQNKADEKTTALELTEAFFSAYSELHSPLGDNAPTPYTFRAHAIERFNQLRDPTDAMRLMLVGVPDRHIRIAPTDVDMADAIRALAMSGERAAATRRVIIDGQPLLRTLQPWVANQPSCIACHNALQPGKEQWRLGDLMGAFVMDVPIAPFLRKARFEASSVAVVIFLLGCAVGLHVFRLQFRRLADDIERRTQRRLNDAIENLEDGFAIYDSDRRTVLCNAAHRRYSAFSKEPDRPLIADAPLDPSSATAQELTLPGEMWISVREVSTRSGDIVRIETDISAMKRREADLLAAKHQAERASRAKSNFLALMSHELRTPLNAIIGFSEIISTEMMGPVPPLYRGYSADINLSGQYLLSVINDILDMANTEAGKVQLVEGPVGLSQAITGCIRLLQTRASAGGVRLRAERMPSVHLVADEMRLKQVLHNLLSNAVKFTPSGGSVSVGVRLEADRSVSVSVVDTGIGMRPDEIPRALAPFEQMDASTRRRFAGTGLGLPLSKVFAELHGGSLEISSEPGLGTRATVRLPAWRILTVGAAVTLAS